MQHVNSAALVYSTTGKESNMKPMHSTIKRLSRCPCCQSRHSPHNSGKGKRGGKSAARQETKRQMVRALSE